MHSRQPLTKYNISQHKRSIKLRGFARFDHSPVLQASSRADPAGARQVTRMRHSSVRARSGGGRVPAGARRAQLAELIERSGFVSIADTAERLGVSSMTIRRDLLALESRGLLTRTHGGALAPESRRPEVFDAEEPIFTLRRRKNAAAKARIARTAAALIGRGETVALDVGTSALALAGELVGRSDLRIFTNNLPAAIRLTASRSPVYLLGGQLRGPELAVIGPATTAQIRDYYFDRFFLGVSGVIESGFYDYALEDSEVKRAFMERAKQVIVLCDASKFGHRALARISAIARCQVVVTDKPPPPHLARAFRRAGIELILAKG
jgi:DeoR/GlpR family transcriptional regulator of sugar metabolism